FSLELDKLRQDEAASREKVDLHRIADLEHKVADAQRALLAFQGRTGLVSLDQFNNRIAALDDLKASERQAQAARVREQASAGRLAATLGVSTSTANRALKLQGDPIFQKLLIRYADSEAEEAQKSGTLGPAHARIEQLDAERSAIRTAMAARGSALAGLNQETVMRFAEVSVSGTRADLFNTMLVKDSNAAGAVAEQSEIHRQIGREGVRSEALVQEAAVLADLTRDLKVSEAVFSSALARLDTNKADPFASYPLVQILQVPTLPRARTSPNMLFTLLGAFSSSILLLCGFLLLWLRQPILRKLMPNA
ncbi:MAG: hypothetical protein ACK5NN_06440, partial [Sphingomonadaceae bacterium]